MRSTHLEFIFDSYFSTSSICSPLNFFPFSPVPYRVSREVSILIRSTCFRSLFSDDRRMKETAYARWMLRRDDFEMDIYGRLIFRVRYARATSFLISLSFLVPRFPNVPDLPRFRLFSRRAFQRIMKRGVRIWWNFWTDMYSFFPLRSCFISQCFRFIWNNK